MLKMILPLVLLVSLNSNASDINVITNLTLKGKKEIVNLTPGSYKIEGEVKSKSIEFQIDGQTVVFKRGSNSVWPKNKEGQIYIPAQDSKQSVDLNANYSDKRTSGGETEWTYQSCVVLTYGQQCSGNGMGGTVCWPVPYSKPGWQSVEFRNETRTETLFAELTTAGKKLATVNHSVSYEQRVILNEGLCF